MKRTPLGIERLESREMLSGNHRIDLDLPAPLPPDKSASIVAASGERAHSEDGVSLETGKGNPPGELQIASTTLFESEYTPLFLGNVHDQVFFYDVHPHQYYSGELVFWNLYVTDGERVTQLQSVLSAVLYYEGDSATTVGNKLYYVIGELTFSDPTGMELWVSDGTESGTHIVKDINPGSEDSNPRYLANIDGVLYFVADDASGTGLWRTDGTEQGTVRIDDPSYEEGFHSAGREVRFETDTRLPSIGTELYASLNPDFEAEYPEYNGFLIKDIRPGPSGSNPSNFMFVPEGERIIDGAPHFGTLYFTANDGTHGQQLWKSDWTEEGTTMVSEPDTPIGLEFRVGDLLYTTNWSAISVTRIDRSSNDPPSIDAPTDAMITPGTGTYLPGFQVSDGDFIGTDADTVPIQVGIRANRGRLTIDGTGLSSVSGSHTSSLVIEGTLNALNQALSTLRYASDESFIGTDVITAVVNDLGHFGEGGPLTAQNEMNIAIDRIRLPGDTDFDGDVDLVDFSRLKRRFGFSPAAWNQGDFNGDNRVDLHDFNLLKSNFSSSEAALALAVDEILEDMTY